MDEQRKIRNPFCCNDLAARKLHVIGSKPCPAQQCVIADAICNAELISQAD